MRTTKACANQAAGGWPSQRGHLVALLPVRAAPLTEPGGDAAARFSGSAVRWPTAWPLSRVPDYFAKSISGWPYALLQGPSSKTSIHGWRTSNVEYDVPARNHSALRVLRPQRHDETGLDQWRRRLVCRVVEPEMKDIKARAFTPLGSQRLGMVERCSKTTTRIRHARRISALGLVAGQLHRLPLLALIQASNGRVLHFGRYRRSTCSWIQDHARDRRTGWLLNGILATVEQTARQIDISSVIRRAWHCGGPARFDDGQINRSVQLFSHIPWCFEKILTEVESAIHRIGAGPPQCHALRITLEMSICRAAARLVASIPLSSPSWRRSRAWSWDPRAC